MKLSDIACQAERLQEDQNASLERSSESEETESSSDPHGAGMVTEPVAVQYAAAISGQKRYVRLLYWNLFYFGWPFQNV